MDYLALAAFLSSLAAVALAVAALLKPESRRIWITLASAGRLLDSAPVRGWPRCDGSAAPALGEMAVGVSGQPNGQ